VSNRRWRLGRPVSCRRSVVLFGLGQANTVPARGWNIHCSTQGEPHGSRGHSPFEGAGSGAITEFGYDDIVDKNATVGLAEFGVDGIPKLAEAHRPSELLVRANEVGNQLVGNSVGDVRDGADALESPQTLCDLTHDH